MLSKHEHPIGQKKHRGSHAEEEDKCNEYKFTNRLEHDANEKPAKIYLCRREHTFFNPLLNEREDLGSWQIPEKKHTSVIILAVCLKIGVDPPGRQKTCATQECWIDANKQSPAKSMDMICERLQVQFMRWAPKSHYKILRDPSFTSLQSTCLSEGKRIQNDRAVFYYNGHGCPDPTSNGEIWVFDEGYTQYIPVAMWDLTAWLDSPTVLIFDCNNAGRLTNAFLKHSNPDIISGCNHALLDTIILAACSADEYLPSRPVLPADLFTACLTTPIKTSVVWYVSQHLINQTGTQAKQRKIFNLLTGITEDMIELLFDPVVSGQYNDRRCPLGELNYIFTAITDTIAYEALPKNLFQRLFRSDQALAPLMRNFLLANRIMRSVNRTPCSVPDIPDTSKSPLWQAWDLAIESALNQLKLDLCEAEGKMLLFPPRNPNSSLNANGDAKRTVSLQMKSLRKNKNGQTEQLDFQNNSLIPPPTKNLLAELHKMMTKLTDKKSLSRKTVRNLTIFTLRCVSGLSPQLRVAYDRVLRNHAWNGTMYKKTLSKQSLEQLFTSLKLIHNIQRKSQLGKRSWVPLNFFLDQMTAFENWLDFGGARSKNPIQLPIVLQVLLAQQHRFRAIELLCRFVDLGSWAIHKVLVIGIYPYILRLILAIRDPPRNLQKGLTFLWSKVIVYDPTIARADLISPKNSKAVNFFFNHIRKTTINEPEWLVTGFYILATIADGCPEGQKLLLEEGVIELAGSVMRSEASSKVRCWASLCIAKLWEGQCEMALMSYNKLHLPEDLVQQLRANDVSYRACAVYTLTSFLLSPDTDLNVDSLKTKRRMALDLGIGKQVAKSFRDGSALVRYEVIHHIAKLIYSQKDEFKELVWQYNIERREKQKKVLIRKSLSNPNLRHMQNVRLTDFAQITGSVCSDDFSPWLTPQPSHKHAYSVLNPVFHGPPSPTPTASTISNCFPKYELSSSPKLLSPSSPCKSTSSMPTIVNDQSRRFIWRVVKVLSADPIEPIQKVAKYLIEFINKLNSPPAVELGLSRQKLYQQTIIFPNILRTTSPSKRLLSLDLDNPFFNNERLAELSEPTSYDIASPMYSVGSSIPEEKTDWMCPQSRLFSWMCDSMLDTRYKANYVSLTQDSLALELTPSFIQRRPGVNERGATKTFESIEFLNSSGIDVPELSIQIPANPLVYGIHQPSGAISPGGYIASFFSEDEKSSSNEETATNISPPLSRDVTNLKDSKLEYSMQYVKLSVERRWRQFWSEKRKLSCDIKQTDRLSERIASFDTKAESITAIRFHDHDPLLYAADCRNRIWVWDYGSPKKLNCFTAKQQYQRGGRITTLRVINQLHDSLLLSGSDDGQVLIWRNAHYQDAQAVVAGFVTDRASRKLSSSVQVRKARDNLEKIQRILPLRTSQRFSSYKRRDHHRPRLPKVVMEWDQGKGMLFTGSSMFRVFDLEQEQFIQDIPTPSSRVTAMELDPTDHGRVVLGCSDGSVMLVDPRKKHPFLGELRLHENHVLRICVQGNQVHSIDPSGLFIVTDMRKAENFGDSMAKIRLKHRLNSFASHNSTRMIATGSVKQFVSLYSTKKFQDPLPRIHQIRFHKGFLGQRIGPVTHLEFHKRDKLLAVGGVDSSVCIFGPNTTNSIIVKDRDLLKYP